MALRLFSLLLAFAFTVPAMAEVKDVACGQRLARRGAVVRWRDGLVRLLRKPLRQWEALESDGVPEFAVGNLSRRELDELRTAVSEARDILALGREGRIRGYGFMRSDFSARRLLAWGGLAAAGGGVSGYAMLDPGVSATLKTIVYGLTAFAALKTLRWMRTFEDNQRAETGIPESQIWEALGPTQSPLQAWLKQVSGEGKIRVVVYVARESVGAIREWHSRRGVGPALDVVRLELGDR